MKTKPKRKITPAQKEAAKQRREQLKSLTKQAESMEVSGVIETVEGHPLSDVNAALVLVQCPAATIVGGFRQWKKHGRQVMKGQKGIAIWFPCRTKQEDEDAEDQSRTFFRVGTVFDISQTEEMPEGAETTERKPRRETKREAPARRKAEPSHEDLLAALNF